MRNFALMVFIGVLNGCTFFELMPPQQSQQSEEAENNPLVYYVGVNDLNLYLQPSSSSEVVARLRLHQKVMRTKLDKGYAYVAVTESGLKGWVDNAKLLWKLPAKTRPTKVEKTPSNTTPEYPVIKEQPKSIGTATPPKTQESGAGSRSQPETISPSIFNPF